MPIVWRSSPSGFRPSPDDGDDERLGGRNDVSGCGNDGRDAANDGSGCGNDDEMLIRRSIPDRSPGHAFIAIALFRLVPAHQGMKIRVHWLVGEF